MKRKRVDKKAKSNKPKAKKAPRNHPDTEPSLLAAVLVLHCEGVMNKDIAKKLKIQPGRVGNIIQEGIDRDLLEYRFRLPLVDLLSQELRKLFHEDVKHREVIVVPLGKVRDKEIKLAAIGRTGAQVVEKYLRPKISLAIDGGESVASVVASVRKVVNGLQLYPVAGGPLLSPLTSVPTLIGRFLGAYGTKTGLKAHLLPEPSKSGRRGPREEAKIKRTLSEASNAELFLLGVGAIASKGSKTANELLSELEIDRETLKRMKVIGVSAYSAFGKQGEHVATDFDNRVTKVNPKDIFKAARAKKGRRVVLVAIGKEKAMSIRAMIVRGWANVLVTDQQTAEAILSIGNAE